MPENDRRTTIAGIRSVAKILTIVAVTATVTALCVRSSGPSPPTENPVSGHIAYRTAGTDDNRTEISTTASASEPSDDRNTVADGLREQVSRNFSDADLTAIEEQGVASKPNVRPNSRSLNADGPAENVNDYRHVGPWISRSVVPPVAVPDVLIRANPTNHKQGDGVDHAENGSDVVDARTHRNTDRQSNRYGHANAVFGRRTGTGRDDDDDDDDDDGFAGHRDPYDPTYKFGAYEVNGAGTEPDYYPPVYGPRYRSPGAGHRPVPSEPCPAPRPPPTGYQSKIAVPTPVRDAIDWQTVGPLALVKLALVKLKAFGVVALLLAALFKLKLFLSLVSVKFLMLLKFVKFFMLPQVLASDKPSLSALLTPAALSATFAIPGRILAFLLGPAAAVAPSAADAPPPAVYPKTRNGVPVATGSQYPVPPPVLDRTAQGFEFDDLNVRYERYYESSSELLDRTSVNVFRKLLDSEKCVERIACRMAAVERAGVVPLLISWIFNGITRVIPNDNLELYFKTYSDINNEIASNISSPDNWSTWCIQRYSCGSNDTTNLVDKE